MPFINIDKTKKQIANNADTVPTTTVTTTSTENTNGDTSYYPSLNQLDQNKAGDQTDGSDDKASQDPQVAFNQAQAPMESKDPESVEGGLLEKAISTPPGDGQVQTKVEDDVKIISKPFTDVSEEQEKKDNETSTEVVNQNNEDTAGVSQKVEQKAENVDLVKEDEIAVSANANVAPQGDLIEAKPLTSNAVTEVPSVQTESSTVYPLIDSVEQAVNVDSQAQKALEATQQAAQEQDVKAIGAVEDKPDVVNKAPSIPKIAKEEIVITPQISTADGDVQSVSAYLDIAVNKNASDVHFTADYPVHIRIDGKLQKLGVDGLTNEQIEALIIPILDEKKQQELEENAEIDMMYDHSSGNRFRVNIFRERGRLAAAFRLIPKKVRTIDELALPEILKEFSRIPYGLVVVTGPTGSGKSTTIAAMIEEINRSEARHIITIEDPVEYIYEKRLALIAQRNMYDDTKDWNNALRSALRQDPNVVVIGEMRDYETIASALTIAETGHLVFATLHTNSAAQTIDRIIDVFPEGQQNQVRSQLSSMLSGVISQRLIPLKNGGRKAAVELLIGTMAIKNAIREGKTHQIDNIIQTSSDIGMISLERSLVDMVRAGEIDIASAKSFTAKPDQIDLLLK